MKPLPARLLDLADYFEPNDASAAATIREAAERIEQLEAESAELLHDLKRCMAREFAALNPLEKD